MSDNLRLSVSDVARQLRAAKNGSTWVARCPVCDDGHGALTIREARDRRVLITCANGCTFAEILERAGLLTAQLFPPTTTERRATTPARKPEGGR